MKYIKVIRRRRTSKSYSTPSHLFFFVFLLFFTKNFLDMGSWNGFSFFSPPILDLCFDYPFPPLVGGDLF